MIHLQHLPGLLVDAVEAVPLDVARVSRIWETLQIPLDLVLTLQPSAEQMSQHFR